MSNIERRDIDFRLLLDHFPTHRAAIGMAVRGNPRFRDISADYCLAYHTLKRFEADPEDRWGVEIADYRIVLLELGVELARLLHTEDVPEVKATTDKPPGSDI